MTFSAANTRDEPPVMPRAHVRPLAVTHVSTNDALGGAARAAHRLHRALDDAGVRSRMLVAQSFRPEEGVVEMNPFAPAPAILGRTFFRIGRRLHRPSVRRAGAYFSPDWSFTGWRLVSQMPACDVVNLHWVADLLDYRSLPRLTERFPVVWTFHDMNAFTGGCHYAGPCTRFRGACGACPLLITSTGDGDMTRRILRRKQRALARVRPGRLVVVCPSRWLADEARGSTLFGRFDVRVIPNGLDLERYRPVDRLEARRQLGLPESARIVLFVADLIEDERKGLRALLAAAEAIRDVPRLLLVTLGRGGAALPSSIAARHLGALHDCAQLRAAYSAADVFAIPSLQDNLPNTILESMACGTPVAGFRSGGVGEAVEHERTGLLAPTGDARELAGVLRCILTDDGLRESFAREARERAEREYSIGLQARRYAALYDEVVEGAARLPGGRAVFA